MGTCACHAGLLPRLNEYERAIDHGENCIGWGKVRAIDLVANLKMYSKQFVLNVNAFILACKNSKLKDPELGGKQYIRDRFFRALISLNTSKIRLDNPYEPESTQQQELFAETDLIVCAIVLGKGTPEEKARELFEHFDDDCDGYLGKPEV